MALQSPYRMLPAARRVELVTRALRGSKDMRALMMSRMLSRGGGFRPQTLMQWPPDKLAREIVRLGAENADDELNLLNMLYVEFEPQIQAAFLDAAGVKHENGQMPEELEPPFASSDGVAKGAAAVVEQFGEDGRHYLLTIAKYNGAGWPGIDAVIAALPPAAPAR
ncbi:MAG: hypothetical protein FJ363_13615 [Gemmatimonadetes bacterium]|nr:hypothetical protein [Gemmatimonadota bacterium]